MRKELEPKKTCANLVKRFMNTIHFSDIAQQRKNALDMQDRTYTILKKAAEPPTFQRQTIPTKPKKAVNVQAF